MRPCFMTHVSPSQPRTFQGNAFATTLPHNPIRALKTSLALGVRQIIPAKKKTWQKRRRVSRPLCIVRGWRQFAADPSTMASNCGVASRPNTWRAFTFRPVPGPTRRTVEEEAEVWATFSFLVPPGGADKMSLSRLAWLGPYISNSSATKLDPISTAPLR